MRELNVCIDGHSLDKVTFHWNHRKAARQRPPRQESCITAAPPAMLLCHPSSSAFHSLLFVFHLPRRFIFFPLSPLIPVIGNMLQEFITFFSTPGWDLNILIPLKTDKLATLGLSWFQGPDLNGWGPLFRASPGGIKVTIGNLPLWVGGWAQSDSRRKNLK